MRPFNAAVPGVEGCLWNNPSWRQWHLHQLRVDEEEGREIVGRAANPETQNHWKWLHSRVICCTLSIKIVQPPQERVWGVSESKVKEICEFEFLEGLRSNIGACSPNWPTKLIGWNRHCPDEKGRKVEIQKISKRRQKGWNRCRSRYDCKSRKYS